VELDTQVISFSQTENMQIELNDEALVSNAPEKFCMSISKPWRGKAPYVSQTSVCRGKSPEAMVW
jgi:hypothetical protein